jgi:hypothetical protein
MTAELARDEGAFPGEQRDAANEPDVSLRSRAAAGAIACRDAHARRAWNPAQGPAPVPAQRPPGPPELLADGTVVGALWASSAGPCRVDPGGAGGSPDGRSLPIRKVVWD